jgi:subtilisin family serine protease
MRFLVSLVVALAPFLTLLSPAAQAFVGVTPELADRMQAMGPKDLVRVNVILKEQHDFAALTGGVATLRGRERRQALSEQMAGRVEASQAPVRRVLGELEARGEAADPRTLVAANGITVWLRRAAIEELASLPEVRSLDWDEDRPVDEVIDRGTATDLAEAAAITWNVNRVRAPEMWALGYTGQGVLIGVIDTGVNYNHFDLRDHMWDGGLDYPNHGWDFVNNDNNPIDEGHSAAPR